MSIGCISDLSWDCLNLVHLSHVCMCMNTSSAILGQKNLSCNKPKVLSIPKCPLSSWHATITLQIKHLGSTNCEMDP